MSAPDIASQPSTAPKMGPVAAIRSVLQNYATFSGRARRAEYWWFILAIILLSQAMESIERAFFAASLFLEQSTGPISLVLSLLTLVPTLSVTARRLHDTGRSGWWQAVAWAPTLLALALVVGFPERESLFIPMAIAMLVGIIALLVMTAQRGTTGPNRFGPDPLEVPA